MSAQKMYIIVVDVINARVQHGVPRTSLSVTLVARAGGCCMV